MNTIVALMAAALITGARTDVPPEQVQPRFESQCTSGRWDAAACPLLRTELETRLFGELQNLSRWQEIDRETLQVAARARFPMLADMGLNKLSKISAPGDREAVLAALEHPSAGIREHARRMLEAQDDAWLKGVAGWWRKSNGNINGFDGLVPDDAPLAEELGLPSVPAIDELHYRYFASATSERRAVFTTALSPEQVLALIAKNARVFNGTQLRAGPAAADAMSKQLAGAQAELQAAAARGDMNAMTEISKRVAAMTQPLRGDPAAALLRPAFEFSAPPASVRYVVLPGPKGQGQLPVTAGVAREPAFGNETVLVIQY